MTMRIARAALAAAILAAPAAQAQSPGVPPAASAAGPGPLAAFGWFAELAGSCWKGEHSDGQTSDTQCYAVQYERLIRGSIKATVTQAGIARTAFEGDAVFARDPRKDGVVYTQWGTGGTYASGEIAVDGDKLVFRNRLPDGTESNVRSIWTRAGADGFRVVRERQEDSGWKEFLAVDYKRVR